jgi:putative heme transporter
LVVEAVLVPGLVSSGMPLPGAISTMLIYRLISWLFLAAIGWVVFFFMFRSQNEVDPDADADPEPEDPASAQLRNGNGPVLGDPADGALQGPLRAPTPPRPRRRIQPRRPVRPQIPASAGVLRKTSRATT